MKVGIFYQIHFCKRARKFNLNREYFRHPALYNIFIMSWKTIQGEQKLASGSARLADRIIIWLNIEFCNIFIKTSMVWAKVKTTFTKFSSPRVARKSRNTLKMQFLINFSDNSQFCSLHFKSVGKIYYEKFSSRFLI